MSFHYSHSKSYQTHCKKSVQVSDVINGTVSRLHNLPLEHWKVLNSITSCRTSKLGGHVLKCDECGHIEYSYNSCRNRHCPQCQSLAKAKWLEKKMSELLPVNYFHVVFTLPDLLNSLILSNKELFFKILFKSIKETLLEAAKNPDNLGAEIGFLAILHTWGQNLFFHPHIHCIVPAGGISSDGKKWINSKNSRFLISVKKLSKLYRGKFIFYLKKAYKNNKIQFLGKVKYYEEKYSFNNLINQLYIKEWVVFSKKPFGGPEQVLKYLGRYTHRIAISNNRLISYKNRKVSFTWKDYKKNNKRKVMELEDTEFIRRFLLHVIPDNFVRIRSFGFLANRLKKKKLSKCKELLNVEVDEVEVDENKETWRESVFRLIGIDPLECNKCKHGQFVIIEDVPQSKYLKSRSRFDSS